MQEFFCPTLDNRAKTYIHFPVPGRAALPSPLPEGAEEASSSTGGDPQERRGARGTDTAPALAGWATAFPGPSFSTLRPKSDRLVLFSVITLIKQ